MTRSQQTDRSQKRSGRYCNFCLRHSVFADGCVWRCIVGRVLQLCTTVFIRSCFQTHFPSSVVPDLCPSFPPLYICLWGICEEHFVWPAVRTVCSGRSCGWAAAAVRRFPQALLPMVVMGTNLETAEEEDAFDTILLKTVVRKPQLGNDIPPNTLHLQEHSAAQTAGTFSFCLSCRFDLWLVTTGIPLMAVHSTWRSCGELLTLSLLPCRPGHSKIQAGQRFAFIHDDGVHLGWFRLNLLKSSCNDHL